MGTKLLKYELEWEEQYSSHRLDTQGEYHVKIKVDKGKVSTSQETLKTDSNLPDARRQAQNSFAFTVLRRNQPHRHCDLGPPELQDSNILLCEHPNVWYVIIAALATDRHLRLNIPPAPHTGSSPAGSC